MKILLSVGALLVLSMVAVRDAALGNDNFAGIFSPTFSEISGYVSGEVLFFPKVGLAGAEDRTPFSLAFAPE